MCLKENGHQNKITKLQLVAQDTGFTERLWKQNLTTLWKDCFSKSFFLSKILEKMLETFCLKLVYKASPSKSLEFNVKGSFFVVNITESMFSPKFISPK